MKILQRKKKRMDGKPGFELVEEIFALIRTLPSSTFLFYYIGSLPFVLGLFYFWTEMSKSSQAYFQIQEKSIQMALLFIWMKCWQSVYMNKVKEFASSEEPQPWSKGRIGKLIAFQTFFHSTGLFLLPLALVILAPFGYTYALYQNFTLLGSGQNKSFKEVFNQSRELAVLWPRQNHILIWLLSPSALFLGVILGTFMLFVLNSMGFLFYGYDEIMSFSIIFLGIFCFFPCSPFGTAIAINFAALILGVPYLLKTLFGIKTIFSMSIGSTFTNTTFPLVVFGLTYLFLDPLVKIGYVLRCFQGLALKNGNDILVELRQVRKKATPLIAIALLFLVVSFSASAQAGPKKPTSKTPTVSSHKLNEAISDTLKQKEYTWRLPRVKPELTEVPIGKKDGILDFFFQSLVETWKKFFNWVEVSLDNFFDWVKKIFSPEEPEFKLGKPGINWSGAIKGLYYILLFMITITLGVLLFKVWKNRDKKEKLKVEPIEFAAPDLEDEEVGADALPEDEWLVLAREMMEKREYRLALRALYLSILAYLSQKEMILIAKHKSNRDYKMELNRKSYAYPDLLGLFSSNVLEFEKGWYGNHPVSEEVLLSFRSNQDKIQRLFSRLENQQGEESS